MARLQAASLDVVVSVLHRSPEHERRRQRTRSYRVRTLTRPEESIRVTRADLDAQADWDEAFMRGLEQGRPEPHQVTWRSRVIGYCKAKRLGSPEFSVHPDPPTGDSIVSWRERYPVGRHG